ncbi:hypothetical protein LPJ66_005644 [Kickxella alabastrina]|uniref:Uncharacterized protein n=1 Tax=Kickxella alabastrina TaxID=61397 RepID=A0ACC1IIA5_9FUNG|nr:hypothetical protein LPJ66_005644 [Kickxella alabastrina]
MSATKDVVQAVDITHKQIKGNTTLRVTSKEFSTARRQTPTYARLLAISNKYGYMVAGTPQGKYH